LKIIDRFLAARYLQSLLLVLIVIGFVIFASSFMQEIAAMPTTAAALDSSFSHFLDMFPIFLPLAAFMGTLLAFYRLTISSELVIIKAGGMSTYKIIRPMLWVSAALGGITAAVVNPLSVRYNAGDLKGSMIERIDGAVWLREKTDKGDLIIRSQGLRAQNDGGLTFIGTTIIRQNARHQIESRIDAREMTLSDSRLSVKSAAILDSAGALTQKDWSAKTALSQDGIVRQYLKPNQVSFWRLPELIAGLSSIGMPATAHILQFLSLLFLPLNLAAMTVLGAMFAQTKERRNFSFARQFGWGIIFCFLAYFMMQIMNAISMSGAMPPVIAAFGPSAIVLAFAWAGIIKSEEI